MQRAKTWSFPGLSWSWDVANGHHRGDAFERRAVVSCSESNQPLAGVSEVVS